MDLNEPPHDKLILKKELSIARVTFNNVSRKTSVLPVWIGLLIGFVGNCIVSVAPTNSPKVLALELERAGPEPTPEAAESSIL